MIVAGGSKSGRKKEKRRPDQSRQTESETETEADTETGSEEAMWVNQSGFGGLSHDKGEPSKQQRWLNLSKRARYSRADNSAVAPSFIFFRPP
jgi:hypothetical protein